MKKTLTLMSSLSVLFALSACGGNDAGQAQSETGEPQTPAESQTTDLTETETEDLMDQQTSNGNVLVVYFSGTGNTERVATSIAEATGADTFELVPTQPYTDEDLDWTDDSSRVNYEHDNPDAQAIELESATADGWDSYDTVFIGYPIWWGNAAWPVNGFVTANDFTGKTVIPFATSASSGLGQSGELLAQMAGSGEWQEGMRFASSVSDDDVRAWVDGLGL